MRLEGIYVTAEEVRQCVLRLKDLGYASDHIVVATNRKMKEKLSGLDAEIITHTESEAESVWTSVKKFFMLDDVYEKLGDDGHEKIPFEYVEEVKRGKIAVFLDGDVKKIISLDTSSKEKLIDKSDDEADDRRFLG